jgi:hypothetical protein
VQLSRRTMLRIAALASKVVASMAMVRPFNKPHRAVFTWVQQRLVTEGAVSRGKRRSGDECGRVSVDSPPRPIPVSVRCRGFYTGSNAEQRLKSRL